jgi:signal transduction histidine kinase
VLEVDTRLARRGGAGTPPDQVGSPAVSHHEAMQQLLPLGNVPSRARPRRLSREALPARLSDVLLVLVCIGSAVPVLVADGGHSRFWGAAVVVVIALPLVARRIWPVPVFATVLVLTAAVGPFDSHVICALALAVALYSVAAHAPRTQALWCAAVLEAGMIGATICYARSDWWFDAIFLSGMVAAALGLGLYLATRRAYLAALHDRAARLERERDQQVALAAAAERARIAREMHDVVAHHLTVMVALSDGAVAASAASPERAAEVMRSVSATGRRALADTRRMLGVLRDTGELTDAVGAGGGERQPVPAMADLGDLIDRVRGAGLPVALEVRGSTDELSEAVQLTVYRLVQEALTNTLKHGGAGAAATVRLVRSTRELTIDVEDDGAGAPAPSAHGVGSGLLGMRERVAAFGGDVRSGPRDQRGWHVSARLRLEP